MNIGQRLKEARKARGMSQDSLAANIGASRGVITNIEHDKVAEPHPLVINAICQILGIRKDWLLYGSGSMEQNQETGRSAKILSELYTYAQELSEEELLFLLDMIKSYQKHLRG